MAGARTSWNIFWVWLGIAALVAFALYGWEPLQNYAKENLPIRFVRVEGTFQYLEKEELQEALSPLVRVSYLAADIGALRRAAEALPWIERAQIRRIWPDTLVVRVYEQQAYARWGDESLLNPRGERFTPKSLQAFQALPKVYGPPGHERYLLGVMKKMDAVLAKRGLLLDELEVSGRRAWTAKLDGGTEVHMGRREPFEALLRMLRVLPLLGDERIADIERIDLRYPGGFAVGWRSPEQSRRSGSDGTAGKLSITAGRHKKA